MRVRNLAHQRNAFRHVKFILGNVIIAERRRRRMRSELKMAWQRPADWTVLDATQTGGRRCRTATKFCYEHGLQRVHGTANVAVAHLFEEYETEAVTAFAVLARCGERMKFRLNAMLLGTEAQTLWQ